MDIETLEFKKIGDITLRARIYKPEGWSADRRRPAVIFFYGGGWINGNIDAFKFQSIYLASKGMVAVTPEYRVRSVHGNNPVECVKDAISAVVWVYDHAEELGIDRERIAVGGASAGGHLAACTAMLDMKDDEGRSSKEIPRALLLFCPATDTTILDFDHQIPPEYLTAISPIHNVREGLPPSIVLHSTDDSLVPFEPHALKFQDLMLRKGNLCVLVPYFSGGHPFFLAQKEFQDTIEKVEGFLRAVKLIG